MDRGDDVEILLHVGQFEGCGVGYLLFDDGCLFVAREVVAVFDVAVTYQCGFQNIGDRALLPVAKLLGGF